MVADCFWKLGRMAPNIGAWRTGTAANKSCSPWASIPTYRFQRHEKAPNRQKSNLQRVLILASSKNSQRYKRNGQHLSSRCRRVAGEIQASVDDLRRSCGSVMANQGTSLAVLGGALGHNTTLQRRSMRGCRLPRCGMHWNRRQGPCWQARTGLKRLCH